MKKRSLLLNIFTSGKEFENSDKMGLSLSDNKIRYILMNFIFIFGALILAAFVAQNILKGSFFDAAVCAVMILVVVAGFLLARLNVSLGLPAVFSMVSYGLFCALLIWNGDAQGAGFLFIYIYPLLTIFLLGMKTGICLSSTQIVVTGVQVFLPSASRFDYPFDVSIRLVTVYVLMLSITVVFEKSRLTKNQLNAKLTEELRVFNENLQRMVEEKTGSIIKLHDTFGRYLPDRVIRQILDSPTGPSLGGEKRYITIMTTDIRGFTPLAEKHETELVVQLLNHYFSIMVEIINSFNGTIIEFLGDSILCIFGAPLEDEWHADKAVACAIKMQSRMEEVNVWSKSNNFPEIEMGIAINTGEAIVGNIGSDRVMKYNVIGNNVNLSSRIESYTSGGQVMLSEYTFNVLRSPVNVVQRAKVSPKGVSNPIFIVQVDAIGSPFNFALDNDAVPLERLKRPVKAICFRIRNKQIGADEFEVLVTHLSRKEGKLSFADDVNSFTVFEELKIYMFGQELLAKINAIEDRNAIKVRFTSDPESFLSELSTDEFQRDVLPG
ncbi:MAG: adenylate/guanylate cyclase domain-containing protein [Spirochaetaceae bacterium]|jgi:class 3 adenylate cyclase|nr:adenylate/guanylate cyclase domain-containing protein [Spirochaetaceae bacterium]